MFINGFIFDGHYNTRCNFFDSENQKKKTYDQIDSREIYYCLEGKSSKCPLK